MDRIGLEGMVFYGYHGDHEEERRLGQRFVVDVELGLDLSRPGASDRLEDTLDYGEAYRTVKAIMEGPSHHLLESLAEAIAQGLLAALAAQEVRVRVSKPSVPLKGPLQRAWVEVVRQRSKGTL
ncbi:MAG: dihydroneopterin aldolase [Chloroflexi bacterium]|nr:dihydroneopterin aldolase [Chloroflexota bacterium]